MVDLMARSADVRPLLEAGLEAALSPLGLSRGAIYLRRGESDEIHLEVQSGLPAQVIARRGRQRIAAEGSGLSGMSAHRKGALILPDLSAEPAARPLVEAFREAGVAVNSAAAFPVVVESKAIGVILVVSEKPRTFEAPEVAYLQLVGALLGWTLVGRQALRDLARTNEELKALTRALEQRTAELKDLDRYKTKSIHLITHEMRKPLSPIFTLSDMMLTMSFPEEKRRQFLEQIRAAADEMNEYIRQMIEAAGLEEGGVQLLFSDVDVVEVAKLAMAKWQREAQEDGVQMELAAPIEKRIVMSDGVKIGEILENLLENAVKYTPKGGRVTLTVARTVDAIEFSVNDTGIGIATEDMPDLFKKFQIVERANVPRPTHRAGLGLYLARVYAEALGGSITVKSEPGAGSTFTLRVPVGP
jgi:signal transduction histidine kinase